MANWFASRQWQLAPILCLFACRGLATSPANEPQWKTVAGQIEKGQLVKAALSGIVTFQVSGAERQMPADSVLWWGTFSESFVHPRAVLVDGSIIMASDVFQSGALIEIADRRATVHNQYLGVETFDLDELRGVILRPHSTNPLADEQTTRILNYEGDQDAVWLVGGDVLSGILERITAKLLVVATESQMLAVPLDRVSMLAFSGKKDRVDDGKKRVAVGLQDATVLFANELEFGEGSGRLVTAGKHTFELPAMDAARWLQGVQFFSSCVYLTGLKPLAYRNIPYLQANWPLGVNESVMGGRIRVNGRPYWKGIAMHTNSRVAFALEGRYQSYHADLAIDDGSGSRGSVVFRVLISSDAADWREAYRSPILRGGDKPVAISIDVRGAHFLTLVAEMADRVDQGDHAVWLDPRLLPASELR